MFTNLSKKYLGYIILPFYILSIVLYCNSTIAQPCSQSLDFNFKASGANNGINWEQFPEFELPFKVVYGGPSSFANYELMFKRGFTHLSNPNALKQIPEKNRAYLFYGVTNSNVPQPWNTIKSPFSNDLSILEKQWDHEVSRIIDETGGKDRITADIFLFDIESQLKSDDSILVLKNSTLVPEEFKKLSNQEFLEKYKRGVQGLYGSAMKYILEKGKVTSPNISSYSDAPILNTFINIQGRSWDTWKTDKSVLNYICYDFDKNTVGGLPYNLQTFMTPSAYFYYDYPHPFAGEYLSYLMFQIEANRAWTNKDLMIFLWGRYSSNKDFVLKNIKPWMTESMAIFPFFAGAKGIWLWDDTSQSSSDLSNFEYFTKGLYRLSKFKSMFEGDYKIIETVSAREYNETKKPIWRGILKDQKLLIAAHNPNAKSEIEEVTIEIKYQNFNKLVTLKGYEVFLCQYDFSLATGIEPEINFLDVKCFPNPTSDVLRVQFSLNVPNKLVLRISDISGRTLYSEKLNSEELIFDKLIDLTTFKTNAVVVTIQGQDSSISKKVIITR